MTDYYGQLGVPPDASMDQLRRAYREQARRLHPDVNASEGGDEAMRRLNEAWRVLGDPESRRRYDQALLVGEDPADPADPADLQDLAHLAHRAAGVRRVRPSVWLVAVAILAAIFVISAYAAGPASVNRDPGSGRPPADQCLARFPGYEAFVPCGQPNLGRVVAEYPSTPTPPPCPTGSVAHPVVGRAEVACLATGG